MHILETDAWSLLLPPEWWAEQEDESVLVGDRDGVGCIEVSTLQRDGTPIDAAALRALARELAPDNRWTPAVLAGREALYAESLEEGAAIREWCLACGPLALYLSYSCDQANRGMDAAAVDDILATLTLDPDLS